MSDTPAPTDTAVEPEVTPTLEQIAKEIPVEEQAKSFTATPQQIQQIQQTQQAPQVQQPYIPDPITDQEGYRRLVAQQLGQTSQLEGLIREVSTKLQTYEQREAQAKVDAEVNDVIANIKDKLNLDPDLVEAALNVRYKKDAAFKHIWDNRSKNPQALNKALDVITKDMQSKFQVRQDPQLAENVRAAKSYQQSSATRKPDPTNGVPTDPREFSMYWSRLINGG